MSGQQSNSRRDTKAIIKRDTHPISRKGESGSIVGTRELAPPISTQRALLLRNGKDGVWGKGEVTKIYGREKLVILAEDAKRQEKEERIKRALESSMLNSVKSPFRLEAIKTMVQSQMDASIDIINTLHKEDLCYDFVLSEIKAICPPRTVIDEQSPGFIAEQFGICVHNMHMLASAWVIVYESIRKMEEMGLVDREVRNQIRGSASMQQIYYLTNDLLRQIVTIIQQRLRNIVQNTEHFHVYFKENKDSRGRHEFRETEASRMYKSFLDSTIIELSFPGSAYNSQVLLALLHVIQYGDRSKEIQYCPQIMWDTIGDLANALMVLDLFETPLLNSEGVAEVDPNLTKVGEFLAWEEAQSMSIAAAMQISSYVNLVNPLQNLTNATLLGKIWDHVNTSYMNEAGQDIDSLWQLVNVRHRIPYFSTLYVPSSSSNEPRPLKQKKGSIRQRSGIPFRISYMDNDEEIPDPTMPDLIVASDSEDERRRRDSSEDDDRDGSDIQSYTSYASDRDYESDLSVEDNLETLHLKALEIYNESSQVVVSDEHASERKNNPFLDLLGSLKGRFITTNPVFRTDGKTTSVSRPGTRKKTRARSKPTAKSQENSPIDDSSTKLANDAGEGAGEHKEVKKRKKKPKKSKKAELVPTRVTIPGPENSIIVSPTSEQSETPETPTTITVDVKPESNQTKSYPSLSRLSVTSASLSTTTLPLPAEQKAESAHSYLSKLGETKAKIKTRPDQPVDTQPLSTSGNLKTRLLGAFGSRDRAIKEIEDPQQSKNSHMVFANLRRKTSEFASKLFASSATDKKGSITWDQFVQIMKELGFTYDPSTAGSSVRFDPSDRNLRSISFHKPHPKTRLHQNKLKNYRDKLNEYYGLSAEKFEMAMESVRGVAEDCDPELEV